MKRWLLRYQLRRTGANKREVIELSNLTRQLSKLTVPEFNRATKQSIASSIGFHTFHHSTAWQYGLGAGVVLLLVSVLSIQYSKPREVMDALKQGSHEVRLVIEKSLHLSQSDKNIRNVKKPSTNPTVITSRKQQKVSDDMTPQRNQEIPSNTKENSQLKAQKKATFVRKLPEKNVVNSHQNSSSSVKSTVDRSKDTSDGVKLENIINIKLSF